MKCNLDLKYYNNKNQYICGVDEVGRGPLAGPLVICAIVLPKDFYLSQIDDSKKISSKLRNILYPLIIKSAISYSLIIKSNIYVDKFNPKKATILSMQLAIDNLSIKPDFILTDAENIGKNYNHIAVIKGDTKSQSIAAASIVAKVYRDKIMVIYDKYYPKYHFSENKGYGTFKHLVALNSYGVTPIHRISYKPVQKLLK